MFKKFLHINVFLILLANISFAETIKSISIDGNKRISKESIIVFGNIIVNNDYNQNELNLLLKDLYITNFFKDIKLTLKNNVLTIKVVENPIIEDLKINGVKNKKLEEALLDIIELKSRKSYIESTFLKDLTLIKNTIKRTGYYFSDIKTSLIKDEKQNSVVLVYDINLGDKAKISQINFIGDKKVKDRKLRNVITSEESKFWKFLSANKSYLDAERINLDKRLLAAYYKDNGFYNVKIENSFVEFTNNGSFKLIFNIDSGNKFTFNKLNLILPDDYEPEYFRSITQLLSEFENQIYSLNKINKILDEIDKIALSKKYEFIDASLTENIVNMNKLDITINLIETEKSYVEKINVLGNQFSYEEIIRNSLIVDEGDPYNEILFNKSINILKSRNIFGSVTSKISEGSDPSLKIIDITVEEKPTGEISLGAGVGTSGGTIGGGIKENNFLGKGIALDTNLSFTKNSVKGYFIYSKPNFNNSDNTLSTSLSSTKLDNMADFGYKTSETSFSLGTTFQQYEDFYFNPEISTSIERLETNGSATPNLKKQAGNYFDLYFNYGLNYDLRDQTYKPTAGYKTTFYQTLPLQSENYEIVNAFTVTKYHTLLSEMIGRISFYGKSVNSLVNEDVRISKRLNIPSNKLRGFESGKIGPIDNKDFVGGNYVTALNISATLPNFLLSLQNTDFSIFFDAANIWGVDYNSSLDDGSKIRSSTGIAVDVWTPLGPLNFSFAAPITKKSTDVTESFRFNIGTSF
jgi:outer membrane protein insertion porin family